MTIITFQSVFWDYRLIVTPTFSVPYMTVWIRSHLSIFFTPILQKTASTMPQHSKSSLPSQSKIAFVIILCVLGPTTKKLPCRWRAKSEGQWFGSSSCHTNPEDYPSTASSCRRPQIPSHPPVAVGPVSGNRVPLRVASVLRTTLWLTIEVWNHW